MILKLRKRHVPRIHFSPWNGVGAAGQVAQHTDVGSSCLEKPQTKVFCSVVDPGWGWGRQEDPSGRVMSGKVLGT